MANNRKFIEEFMEVTNIYRKRHRVEPLVLNKNISKISQKWADKLSSMKSIKHQDDPKYNGKELGENIAIRYNSSSNYYSGHRAVGQWYKEINDYSFENSSGPNTGHFTQLVWKDSKEVGVGRAQTSEGKWIVVANYYPAGNFIGRYGQNVFPPKDNDTSLLWAPGDKDEDSASGDASLPVGVSFWDKQFSTCREMFHGFHFRSRRDEKGEGSENANDEPSGSGTKVRTETTTRMTKSGKGYVVQETTKTTKTMADGSTMTSTRTVTRSATKDEIKKLKG